MEQPPSKIYNSLRYDDTAGIVPFHRCEQDWDQLKSRGLMSFSSLELITVASLSSPKIPLEVIEYHKLFLGDERVKNRGQVDPIQTFGLFSVQLLNIVEANNAKGQTLKVHVKVFSFFKIPSASKLSQNSEQKRSHLLTEDKMQIRIKTVNTKR